VLDSGSTRSHSLPLPARAQTAPVPVLLSGPPYESNALGKGRFG
jgi:hypothetical protein